LWQGKPHSAYFYLFSVQRLGLNLLLLVTLITFETLLAGLEREYVNYVDIMAELKKPIMLQLDDAKVWAISFSFIVSTFGIFLAFTGMTLKKQRVNYDHSS
jgi:hypothetical protein